MIFLYGDFWQSIQSGRNRGQTVAPDLTRLTTSALASQLSEKALALFHDGKYRETIATLDQRASVRPEDQGMGLIRAWSLYHLGRYDLSLRLFTDLDRRQSTKDTQYSVYYSRRKLDPTHIGD